jgi:class 3 adenylate cyclase
MPLFMDRHQVPETSAADVAKFHASDLELADKYGVQFLSFWFDPDTGGAFCIARAPARENLEAVHRESHGLVPSEIIPVSEDALLRFLGKVHVNDAELASAFRTILFTDIEGSTALVEELDTPTYMGLLTEHDVIVRRALVVGRGREVKHTGDGIMASFDDVAGALECALAIKTEFGAGVDERRKPALRVRIGLAAGEPVDHNDDLFGATVNLASRLCTVARPGSVVVSDVVRELGSDCGFVFVELDQLELKGFSSPVRAFELLGANAEA